MVAACTCVMGTHDHKARYNPTISTSFLVGLCVSTLTGKNQPSRPWDPFSLRKASRPVPSLDGRYTGLFVPAKPRSRFGDKTCSEKQPIATLHTALLKHIQAPYIFSLDCSIDGSIWRLNTFIDLMVANLTDLFPFPLCIISHTCVVSCRVVSWRTSNGTSKVFCLPMRSSSDWWNLLKFGTCDTDRIDGWSFCRHPNPNPNPQ